MALSNDTAAKLTMDFASTRPVTSTSTVSTLSEARTAELLARMEPLPKIDNTGAPSMRAPSPPPPRAGAIAPIAFAAPVGKPPGNGPLGAVTRDVAPMGAPTILPAGDVSASTEIRVRFADAMVPVAQIGMVDAPPARIEPATKGTWRWIDTRVLGFFPEGGRLAQATAYKVTVPAGVRTLEGGALAEDKVGTFATKPLGLRDVFPAQVRPDSALAVVFDAAIDPAKLAPFLRVQTRAGKQFRFRVVDRDAAQVTWDRMPNLGVRDVNLGTHRVFLIPETTWPAGTELVVALTKGAPTTEGPIAVQQPQYAGFTVVPPFKLSGLDCEDEGKPRIANFTCGALNAFSVRFTNAVEPSSFRAQKLQIAGMELEDRYLYGDTVSVWAPDVAGKRFELTIGSGLVDIYGQPYVGPTRVPFTTTQHVWAPYLDTQTGFHVIDPRFQIPQYVIEARSLSQFRVELYKVTPADYFAYDEVERDPKAKVPGKRVYDQTFTVGPRHAADLRVDLRPYLVSGTGHLIAVTTIVPAGKTPSWFQRRSVAWVQVTKLGLTSRHDGDKVSVWTREIDPAKFLAAIPGATVSLIREGDRGVPTGSATSSADGHAAFELPEPRVIKNSPVSTPSIVVAQLGTDSTFVSFGSDRAKRGETARWYVTDDRFTYKPGEKVYVKGWVRWSSTGTNPDIAFPRAGETVTWSLTDARRNKIGEGTARLSDQGGFDLETSLPDTANLGTATFTFSTRTERTSHPIAIQEFRTPAYLVSLADDTQFSGARPLYAGESIEMRAEAKYFAGGGLPGAGIHWLATLRPTTFTPPGWDNFTFDPAGPRSDRAERWRGARVRGEPIERGQETTLAGDSTSTTTFSIAQTPAHRPAILEVDTTIADLDRMQIRASSRPILVHPSMYYVGVRSQPQNPEVLEAVVTDVDGKAVTGVPIEIRIEGVLGSERYRDDAAIVDTQTCKVASGTAPVTCAWTRKKDQWSYTAIARVADARGRESSTEYAIPWWSWSTDRDLTLAPDKPMYRPGDTAKVTIHSKTLPAAAIVTIARNGIVREQEVQLTKPATIVEVPIEAAYIANVHVVVDRWSARTQTRGGSKLPIPEHVQEQLELSVDLQSARLEMTTTPDRPLVEPGEMAGFEVSVKKDGAPVANAEVALMVIDEAVLSLSSQKHADPLLEFYQEYPSNAFSVQSLDLVRDQGPELAGDPGFKRSSLDGTLGHGSGTGSGYGVGGGRGGMSGRSIASPIVEARKDFRPVAVFSPLLHTDKNGKTRVRVKMPDNLTRYRIVALATANMRHFGKAENVIVAQRAINARTIAPRFLTQGDRFSLPVLVQNLAGTPREIDVAVRAGNLASTGPQGKRVVLGAGQRAELRFDFATQTRGKAVIQTILVAGAQTDASTLELPVWEPATTESFATYGVVGDKPDERPARSGAAGAAEVSDKVAFEQLVVPSNVFPDVGGVELELASTQLQSLTDAYWYLQAYPYECAEQRSSRMLATTAMYDILDAYATPGRPTRDELGVQRELDVQKLTRDQLSSGGWGYFPGMKVDPFVTAQVLTALGAQGITGDVRDRARTYVFDTVTSQLAKLDAIAATPEIQRKDRSQEPYLVSVAAAGLSALAAAKSDVRTRAVRLHDVATKLGAYPMDAKARVLALLAKQDKSKAIRAKLVADILSATTETASAATVAASYTDAERLVIVSSTKTNALALDALMREVPENALIPKLARGVLDGRASGRWRTTQENLVVLQTMRRYFDTYEKIEPNFIGKLWLGKAAYSEAPFLGRSSHRAIARAGWDVLAPGSAHDLAITKDGPGRMYYRVGITYAPTKTDLPALDAGFVVRRTYTAVDDPKDVAQLPDGRWRVRLGARVLVTIQASTSAPRHAVAVVDPLPAGFEPVNEALANAERAVKVDGDSRWGHRAMRDNRAEAFSMSLAGGTHQFSYTARATTPGTFLAAPAKAEEMYSPETFGRSTGLTVVVE